MHAYVTLVSMQWLCLARAVFILIRCQYYTVTGNSMREIYKKNIILSLTTLERLHIK